MYTNVKLRKNLLPRNIPDAVLLCGLVVFLPIVLIFDITIILPAVYKPYEFMYVITFTMAMFLIFNIKSNLLSCILLDTSVDFDKIEPPNNAVADHRWRICAKCDHKLAPPRSWHCNTCKTCVLKRDHHCTFTGCCIGHKNHRYFFFFALYLFIGATYSLIYQIYYFYVLYNGIFLNYWTIAKMICPPLLIMSGEAIYNIPIFFHSLNLLAVLVSGGVLLDQLYLLYSGGDRSKNFPYNRGFKKNLQTILGKRSHLVWISPFIKSDLPSDGISWDENKEKDN